uniref:Endoplasmic reticulum junction formation protein lunapark n=1 Tax=Trichuris muris TaxID=70415 RepID=A0A5S6QLT8_TRIMR
MGLFPSKKQKKSYSVVLEQLEDEIEELCHCDVELREQEWRFDVGFFLLVVLSYIILTYLTFADKTHPRRYEPLWLLVCLFGYPFLLYWLRRVFAFYFARRRRNCHAQLDALKEQRAQVLNEVKENEPYKVAKELLDRFDIANSRPRPRHASASNDAIPPDQTPMQTPWRSVPPSAKRHAEAYGQIAANPVTPRPVLPLQRSWWEHLMDAVLRDGPSYRYALICMYCKGHNGMAIIEEFEDLSFRCCYCNMLNPSKRQMKDKRQSRSSPEAKDKSLQPSAAGTTKVSRPTSGDDEPGSSEHVAKKPQD